VRRVLRSASGGAAVRAHAAHLSPDEHRLLLAAPDPRIGFTSFFFFTFFSFWWDLRWDLVGSRLDVGLDVGPECQT
jgi:hypothetical protein